MSALVDDAPTSGLTPVQQARLLSPEGRAALELLFAVNLACVTAFARGYGEKGGIAALFVPAQSARDHLAYEIGAWIFRGGPLPGLPLPEPPPSMLPPEPLSVACREARRRAHERLAEVAEAARSAGAPLSALLHDPEDHLGLLGVERGRLPALAGEGPTP